MKDAFSKQVEEREFVVNGFRYAAKLWGKGDIPIIALHGWLDNGSSFDVIAPILCEALNVTILAPDLAGHGLSDHRNGFTDYPLWSEILPIYAMADQMAWEEFTLIGHSRGAIISSLVASIFPERIKQLILLDALTAFPVEAANSYDRIKTNIKRMQSKMQRRLSIYPTYEAAIRARSMSDIIAVKTDTAKILAVRGLSQVEGGYRWHSDDKLWGGSYFALTANQIREYVKNIKAQTLILIGEHNFESICKKNGVSNEFVEEIIDILNADVQYFDDGHYLHMQNAATDVAGSIVKFIANSSLH